MAAAGACPAFLYGTAWKEDETRRLTALAIGHGFRGIDTANQRKHYFEAAVGDGIADAIAEGVVSRDDLFLQTKFTHRRGQDDRLPYDPSAPIATQVAQSFDASLEHLGTDHIDSYVLHGPSTRQGLAAQDIEAWGAMEVIADSGRAGVLGVSNVTAEQLDLLCRTARIKPAFVQNRCYAVQAWDWKTRQISAEHDVCYQGFSLLTANRTVLAAAGLRAIADRHGIAPAQAVFAFARAVGMVALTGTTSAHHMAMDLATTSINLTPDDVSAIERIALKPKKPRS